MNRQIGYIYIITNTASNKKYIGSTIRRPAIRKSEHWYALRKHRHGNAHLQSAWNKNGENAFTFEIYLSVLDITQLHTIEEETCRFFNTFNKDIGYNIDCPESCIRLITEEERQRRSQRLKQLKPHLGHKHSIKTKEILRAQRIGRYTGSDNFNYGNTWTMEQRQRASAAKKEWYRQNPDAIQKLSELRKGMSPRRGWSMTETQKEQILNSRKDKVRVLKLDSNGNAIGEFRSIREWARAHKVSRDVLRRVIRLGIEFDGAYWRLSGSN